MTNQFTSATIPKAYHQVALLGRPNVGKSTLFNRLVGKRKAVVSDIAGTTRDRLQQVITHQKQQFVLVDMAGIEPALSEKTEISIGTQRQVEQALKDASLIIWVVDRLDGVTVQDERVAELVRRLNKPVIVAVNKCDAEQHESDQLEFMRFGFQPLIPISAVHNRGVLELLDAVVAGLTPLPSPTVPHLYEDGERRELTIAILGRPNVGKSTLLNTIVGEERSVVSPVSGTTRDAVDTVISADGFFGNTFTKFQTLRIVDTAGIRQRGKMGHEIEAWSVLRSLDSLDDAEIALLLVDASEGVTHQDLIVAQKIVDAGKPLILMVNKWDLVLAKRGLVAGTLEADAAQEELLNQLIRKAPFLGWCQVIFVSALTKLNVRYLGGLVLRAHHAWNFTPKEEELREITAELQKSPRLKNLVSIAFQRNKPPVFIVHLHGSLLPHFTTRRFLENALRDFFELGPTPMKLWFERSQRDGRAGGARKNRNPKKR
jgi:GTP-binding protein